MSMYSFIRWGSGTLALLLCSAGYAASAVELLRVGTEAVGNPPCVDSTSANTPAGVIPNRIISVEMDARRVSPGVPLSGSIRPVSVFPGFAFSDNNNQQVVFQHDRPSAPSHFSFRTPAHQYVGTNYFLQFAAVDNLGIASAPRHCVMNVVRPDFRIGELHVASPGNQGIRQISATIHSFTQAELVNVPWSIWAKTAGGLGRPATTIILKRGIVASISAGRTFAISAQLHPRTLQNAGMATTTIGASVDPANTLNEAEHARSDNSVSMGVRPISVETLDPAKASAAGAVFVNNISGLSACNRLGVGDWRDTNWDGWAETQRSTGVLFIADCVSVFPAPLTGGRADPEAYKGFLLKNGWKIRSAEVSDVYSGGGTFRWVIAPMIGTNDPHIQMHLAADTMQVIKRGVRILIEGPAGTSPYTGPP